MFGENILNYFSQGLSLRKIVAEMDNKINLKTAFYWRHKILEVMEFCFENPLF